MASKYRVLVDLSYQLKASDPPEDELHFKAGEEREDLPAALIKTALPQGWIEEVTDGNVG